MTSNMTYTMSATSQWYTSPPDAAYSLTIRPDHITAEQRQRCNLVQDLLVALSFPSDQSLCDDLSHGKIVAAPYSSLTPADVRLNRLLRGECPHAAAGKHRSDPHPPSLSPPAHLPGQVLSIDIHLLPGPSLGGFTHRCTIIDEHSTYLGEIGLKSKSTQDVFDGLMAYIKCVYKANDHKVSVIHGDDEAINRSLALLLAAEGIRLQLSPAGHHARRVERWIQTEDNRVLAKQSHLPYPMPKELTLDCHKAIVAVMNDSINSRSYPLTPTEIVLKKKATRLPIPFGSCWSVPASPLKRRAQAVATSSTIKHIPKTEVGVCLGPCLRSDSYRFLLANGEVVSRRPTHPLPDTFVPFGWPAKTHIIRVPLPSSIPGHPEQIIVPPPAQPTREMSPTSTSALTADPPSPQVLANDPVPASPPPLPDPEPTEEPPNVASSVPPSVLAAPRAHLSRRAHHQPRYGPEGYTTPPTLAPTRRRNPFTAYLANKSKPAVPPPRRRPDVFTAYLAGKSKPAVPPPRRRPDVFTAYLAGKNRPTKTTPEPSSTHLDRKLLLNRQTTIRNRAFRETLNLGTLSNAPTHILPNPDKYPPRQEVKYKEAIRKWDKKAVHAAFVKEVKYKLFNKYDALRLIRYKDIKPNAIKLHSQMIYKQKLNGTISGRLPVDGSRQPPGSYAETYASTSDQTNRNLATAAILRDCANRGTLPDLKYGNFDVPAAFINGNPLTEDMTGGCQVVLKLPNDLPDKSLAGRWAEVKQCLYGLKQSNHEFDVRFNDFLTSLGYTPLPSDPKMYIKRAPDGTLIVIDMHVDDGSFISDSDEFMTELEVALKKRYGEEVTFTRDSAGVCSVRLTRLPTGDVKLDCGPYILKMLHKCGMDDVPPALTPSLPGLFAEKGDRKPLGPADKRDYQAVNGMLIHPMSTRFDLLLEIGHLCSRNQNPTVADRKKQIQVLRYLKAFPDLGPVYSAKPGPIELVGSSDASHAVHVDGSSHTGHTIAIGLVNAPFAAASVAERSSVSPDAMSAEYKSLGRLAKKVVYFRQILTELGYPQPHPTVLQTDSQSSINLVVAPQVTRKSRHIFIQHHYIRSLAKHRHVKPVHVGTNDLAADMLTKQLSTNKFLYGRARLFNTLPASLSTNTENTDNT